MTKKRIDLTNVPLLDTPIVGMSLWLFKTSIKAYMIGEEHKMKPKRNPLTREETRAARAYWKKYRGHISMSCHQFFKEKTGAFDVRFIPTGIYHALIDPYFNHPIVVYGTDNKNYYDLLFPEVRRPRTVLHMINGLCCDADYRPIDPDSALALCRAAGDIVGKEAVFTFDSYGISFWDTSKGEDALRSFFASLSPDSVVQERLVQHPDLAALHPSSVNPVRVMTLLFEGEIHVLPPLVRIGVNGSRTDRAADGGLVCGIEADGRLKPVAYTEYGIAYRQHPQGFRFSDGRVPSIDKIKDMARRLHARVGNYRLVAWDISVDESGEPVLIEVNLNSGCSVILQLANGPLFGDLTERVLEEIFVTRPKRRRLQPQRRPEAGRAPESGLAGRSELPEAPALSTVLGSSDGSDLSAMLSRSDGSDLQSDP